jgi:hypothetical protein
VAPEDVYLEGDLGKVRIGPKYSAQTIVKIGDTHNRRPSSPSFVGEWFSAIHYAL